MTAGANPMGLKRGIEKAVEARRRRARASSRKQVKDRKEIAQVATISANGDTTIGEIIADAMDKVGKDGTITVEEAKGIETTLDVVEGMQFDKGYLSPYFVTNAESMEAVLEDAYILIHEKKISQPARTCCRCCEKVAKTGQPAADHRRGRRGRSPGDAGGQQAARHPAGVRRQGPGLRRPPQGHARGHRDPHRRPVHHRGPRHQARERRARATSAAPSASRSTRKTPPSSKAPARPPTSRAAINQIRRQIEETTSDYDREKLQERLAKLAGGVAVINVGAATETEMKEKKARVEDALHATRAAVEEGIVAGGGVALLRCQSGARQGRSSTGDEAIGVGIVRKALRSPAAPARRQRRPRRRRSSSRKSRRRKGNVGYNVATGQVRRPGQGRHHRSDQGDPHARCRTRRPSPACC